MPSFAGPNGLCQNQAFAPQLFIMTGSPWYLYCVRCQDNSLYTGITTDLVKRLAAHNGLRGGGAKYTQARRPVTLVFQQAFADRASASKAEHQHKRLSKAEKEQRITQYQLTNGCLADLEPKATD